MEYYLFPREMSYPATKRHGANTDYHVKEAPCMIPNVQDGTLEKARL